VVERCIYTRIENEGKMKDIYKLEIYVQIFTIENVI